MCFLPLNAKRGLACVSGAISQGRYVVTKHVVLIHGAWLTPHSWDGWKAAFERAGYTVQAPAWPYLDGDVAAINANPNPALGSVGIPQLVEHYADVIKELPEKPLLVGHSFGGLITQLLLNQGLGAAGVALDPAPPRGVLPSGPALKAAMPVLTKVGGWKKVHRMSLESFAKTFGNALAADQQRATYEAQIVPTSGKIFWQAAFGIGTGITWAKPDRAPLLLTAGGQDRTVTPGMVRVNYKKQASAPCKTEILELPGFCHFFMVQPGWEGIVQQIIDWAEDAGGH
jgi:pimeloyl-ACP methyl ester carboxylesterase